MRLGRCQSRCRPSLDGKRCGGCSRLLRSVKGLFSISSLEMNGEYKVAFGKENIIQRELLKSTSFHNLFKFELTFISNPINFKKRVVTSPNENLTKEGRYSAPKTLKYSHINPSEASGRGRNHRGGSRGERPKNHIRRDPKQTDPEGSDGDHFLHCW